MLKVFAIGFLLVVQSVAWWELGHMVTSQIAQNYLKEMNQTEILNNFTQLITAFNDFTDGRSNNFVEAAVWPDDIKEYKATFFDSYHFTDMVYDPQYMFKGMTDPQKDVNSVNIVNNCFSVLKTNKNGITFERAFMARYLLHVVGDIHQPLHCTNMFNQTLKTGDLGGNLVKIKTKDGKDINLHAFMDSMAGEQKDQEKMVRPLDDIGKVRVKGLAGNIMKQFPSASFGDLTNQLSPHSWTVESYEAAVKQIYPFVFLTNVATEEWTNLMSTLSRQRVALGGYRLANYIVKIYNTA